MSQVRLEEQDGTNVLFLSGQFTGGEESDLLEDTLREIILLEKKKLILDLKDVSYLNSAALGIMISTHINFTKRNGKIVLCNISKAIENIFTVTKLTLVFQITGTLDEAIKLILR